MKRIYTSCLALSLFLLASCSSDTGRVPIQNFDFEYKPYVKNTSDKVIKRSAYKDKLHGFWLGQCIANWTGLVTEMDKIGNIGEIKTGDFYTREDWGKADQPSIFNPDEPSSISPTIDFVIENEDGIWGADDDTDIEYIYQELLLQNETSLLSGEQIRRGWLDHIKLTEENYLWVSNQKALDLMKDGVAPPATSDPENNPEYDMIDAQLTTEIFGFFAPTRPDFSLKMADLPIQTSARGNAKLISEFNVLMYNYATQVDPSINLKDQIFWMANEAKKHLPKTSTPAKMYDFVLGKYNEGASWEQARDAVYQRYQVEQADGYDMTSQNKYCNGCFAAGINYAASLVSLFYGEGDIIQTIKIGALAGWDSDNPTATWGGLIGFMIGKKGVEEAFGQKMSNTFNIHRTRVNFPNDGIDNFEKMAEKGMFVIDRVVQDDLGGGIDIDRDAWLIPIKQ